MILCVSECVCVCQRDRKREREKKDWFFFTSFLLSFVPCVRDDGRPVGWEWVLRVTRGLGNTFCVDCSEDEE